MPIRALTATIALSFLAAAPAIAAAPAMDARAAVIVAEKDFDAYTHEHGYTKGFFAWSAPDAIAFHPQALRIHDVLAARLKIDPSEKDAPSKLRWAPYRVEVSSSSDLAMDLGTWTVEGTSNAGWFLTIWKKQPKGKWLWELDAGAGTAEASALPAAPVAVTNPSHIKTADAQAKADVAKLDQALNQMLAIGPAVDALTKGRSGWLDPSAVVLASDRAPANSDEDIAASLKTRPLGATWTPDGGDASRAGDFVYTYGHVAAADGTDLGHYVRVWVKRGKDWTLLADLYGVSGT
ncbi:MAG: hypothetical protein ACXU8U_08815 [Asticcacaulis sp.]